jgi:pimeloyl-ACP methyl ester carboxylesterase
MEFLNALKLTNPIVMGCSIGGRVILHLALRHGKSFKAVIGLQSALFAQDQSLGDPNPTNVLHRPDIHGGQIAGALMAGMTAPQSPSNERWETIWHYMQGGPGVFKGDLNYYFIDGDLRKGSAEQLRYSDCPIYLLNGEYDASATPEMGKELAELINAEHFEIMKNVGHFPMSENPEEFRNYLIPVLNKILENA